MTDRGPGESALDLGAALERPRPALPKRADLERLTRDELISVCDLYERRLAHSEELRTGLAAALHEAHIAAGLKIGDRVPRAALPPQTGNPPPDATNFGLLTCALELLAANEREYAPSNAATDWYLRDQRVIALLREVLLRGNL